MNDAEVNKTISQMVRCVAGVLGGSRRALARRARRRARSHISSLTHPHHTTQLNRFIKQEAEEKAAEVAVAAEEEFNISKLRLVEAEKGRARAEHERRAAAARVAAKVERSKCLNEGRLRVLAAREAAAGAALAAARRALAAAAADPVKYGALLEGLALQALRALGEPVARLRCREADAPTLRVLLPRLPAAYSARYGGEASAAPTVTLDEGGWLPPAPSAAALAAGGAAADDDDEFGAAAACAGGVVATSADGRVVCANTLDDRLRVAYAASLPAMRAALFGEA
jgi:V-type H+-transporting ATPase subunit E